MVQEKTRCSTSGPGSKETQSLRTEWRIGVQLVRVRQTSKQQQTEAQLTNSSLKEMGSVRQEVCFLLSEEEMH